MALECPKSVKNQWQSHLVSLMKARFEMVIYNLKIILFSNIQQCRLNLQLDAKTQFKLISSPDVERSNPVIMDTFTSSVLKAINEGVLKVIVYGRARSVHTA